MYDIALQGKSLLPKSSGPGCLEILCEHNPSIRGLKNVGSELSEPESHPVYTTCATELCLLRVYVPISYPTKNEKQRNWDLKETEKGKECTTGENGERIQKINGPPIQGVYLAVRKHHVVLGRR